MTVSGAVLVADPLPRNAVARLDRFFEDTVIFCFLEIDDAVARAQTELGDAFQVVPGSMPVPGGSNGEIGMCGVTKGSAIRAVLEHPDIDRADAIGIGDSWNDVETSDVCGVGIARGNAGDELKALADEVTTSVLDDGVAHAFRRLGLI